LSTTRSRASGTSEATELGADDLGRIAGTVQEIRDTNGTWSRVALLRTETGAHAWVQVRSTDSVAVGSPHRGVPLAPIETHRIALGPNQHVEGCLVAAPDDLAALSTVPPITVHTGTGECITFGPMRTVWARPETGTATETDVTSTAMRPVQNSLTIGMAPTMLARPTAGPGGPSL